jgi:cystathionine beta-lyase family protein involved in aluminum resistance
MPYISKSDRSDINQKIVYAGRSIHNTGELNYLVTRIIDEYIHAKGKSYTSINEVIGVLECAKLELYRRIAAPYEDLKIKENGDVYTV